MAAMTKAERLQDAVRSADRGYLAMLDFENFGELNRERLTRRPEVGFGGVFPAQPDEEHEMLSTSQAAFGVGGKAGRAEKRALAETIMGRSSWPAADPDDASAVIGGPGGPVGGRGAGGGARSAAAQEPSMTSLVLKGDRRSPGASAARKAGITTASSEKEASLRHGRNIWMDW